jgi:hypothetical protein
MSYFDDASLVMIPSGYKDQKVYSVKPLDGSGDLTFSRASSATRVASDGLIEKVRTNLVTYSEDFANADWIANNATITSNATTSPTGTTTADKIAEDNSNTDHKTRQAFTFSATETSWSVYAKASERTFCAINAFDGTNLFGYTFNLSNGTLGSAVSGSATVSASIVSAGSGWYRCSITFNPAAGAGQVNVGTALDASTTSYTGTTGSGIFVWGGQLETGVTTDYIATTSAAVSVGPVSGLPRLDYLNSTCPRLLLEPQRTNLLTSSEDFNSWTLIGGGSVTSNSTTSPDGYANADTIEPLGYARRLFTMASGSNTFSIYLKAKDTNCIVRIGFLGTGDSSLIDTQSTITTSGWTRMTLTYTNATAPLGVYFNIQSGDNDVYAWGAQVEAGAYATSYIPTLGTSVTRVADAASKTGISSLIGQTNGAFFVDITFGNSRNSWLFSLVSNDWINDAFYLETTGANNYISIATVKSGAGAGGASSTFAAVNGVRAKIAVQYTSTTLNLFINGVKYSGTRTAIPACTSLYIDELGTFGASDNQKNTNRFNQVLTFTSALTDAQCIELTTL